MPTSAPLFSLAGKVAIITGSSRGIGRAIAERMATRRLGRVDGGVTC